MELSFEGFTPCNRVNTRTEGLLEMLLPIKKECCFSYNIQNLRGFSDVLKFGLAGSTNEFLTNEFLTDSISSPV